MTAVYVALAMVAFAANSVLCRIALSDSGNDPASFTALRLLSGAVFLIILMWFRTRSSVSTGSAKKHSDALSFSGLSAPLFLFMYAAAFSFAYVSLDTGTGALILFTSVQLSLILWSLLSGVRLIWLEWIGLATAFSGFVYLVAPTVTSPDISALGLMVLSGMAWAGYTVIGKRSKAPLESTAKNFVWAVPFCALLLPWWLTEGQINQQGIIMAIASGAIASGAGYAIWYQVLPKLTTSSAAVVQLTVPPLAAIGGVLFASDPFSGRLVLASVVILSGISAVVYAARLK